MKTALFAAFALAIIATAPAFGQTATKQVPIAEETVVLTYNSTFTGSGHVFEYIPRNQPGSVCIIVITEGHGNNASSSIPAITCLPKP